MINYVEMLKKKIEDSSLIEVAKKLGVVPGTINRWILLNNIPKQYIFDLHEMCELEINYENFSYREKDQFFTPDSTSEICVNLFKEKMKELGENLDDYTFIEPAVGSGSFFRLFPENRRIGIDIEPRIEGTIKQNYLKWTPENVDKKYIVLGNPPFGLRGNLALRFIEHSSHFSEYVAFILPQFFESDGRGTPKKRIKNMSPILSERINSVFEYPDGVEVQVNVIFQIWSKKHLKNSIDKKSCDSYLKIFSLSDGGTPGTTRNKKWINKCHFYLPSTCFGVENMKTLNSFEDLPGKKGYGLLILKDEKNLRNFLKNASWSDVAFFSTNSAINIRKSLIIKYLVDNGYCD